MDASTWNWDAGERVVADTREWQNRFEWVEELQASPDGESVAAIVKSGEGEFAVCVNGETWENPYDKLWYLRYAPDGRLTVLAQVDGMWTLSVDGADWENQYDYVWGTCFSRDGSTIATSIQDGGRYGMCVNDEPWEELYENANHFQLTPDGAHTAAVVQQRSLGQADITTFKEGIFAAALDGKAWDPLFVNLWNLAISADGRRVAAEGRLNLYDYTIIVDGVPWNGIFQSVWQPRFNPATGAVVAPGRRGGKWTLYQDNAPLWHSSYTQCWNHTFAPDGSRLAAIVALKLGVWTVAVDNKPWNSTMSGIVSDLTFSPNGKSIAALGKNDEKSWQIMVDDHVWDGVFDMAYAPVFNADGSVCAVKVDRGGTFDYAINGRLMSGNFEAAFDPIFSPAGDKLLVRAVKDGKFLRRVVPVSNIL